MHHLVKKHITLLLVTALMVCQLAPLVSAQSAQSTFTTSLTTFGADTTAPTTPTDLVATAVSSSQIDLSWTASTDDIGVAGYRIFRDSIFIATSSGTTYSDLGLSPETPYTYTVQAFDNSYNYSGMSLPATATTSAVVITPPNPPGGGGNPPGTSGSTNPVIENVQVIPTTNQALISFTTNVSTQSKIFWGKTHEYETGSLSGLFYGTSHELNITGLEQGTVYYVRIEATDYRGVRAVAETSFMTLAPTVIRPFPNPSNFTATPINDYIRLNWVNPNDPRFENVRIIRSDQFFPRDPYDGIPLYEGRSSTYNDRDVVVGRTYYYALFARSNDGSYSSGALAQARILPSGEIAPPSGDPFENIPQALNVDPRIAALTLSDFDFIQEGRFLTNIGNDTVGINGNIALTIRLRYDKVPEILKTIAFSLSDPDDASKVFPFLLRINADKTQYEATIGALGRSGNYGLSIVIVDYKNQGLKRIHGNLRALVFSVVADTRRGFDPLGFLLLVLLIFLICFVLLHRRHDDEAREELERAQSERAKQVQVVSL